jgi:hypothetical protein
MIEYSTALSLSSGTSNFFGFFLSFSLFHQESFQKKPFAVDKTVENRESRQHRPKSSTLRAGGH